jgi:hypothetical protein
MTVQNYIQLEKNKMLSDYLKQNGKIVISNLKEVETKPIDLIIMNHVLEHIESSLDFLKDVLNCFPTASIILLQTNHQGFIPKYFPYFWYGWQLNQHYYHFTPKVFQILEKNKVISISNIAFYKLPQKISFSFKGIIKLVLKFINIFIPNDKSDAFLIVLRKNS